MEEEKVRRIAGSADCVRTSLVVRPCLVVHFISTLASFSLICVHLCASVDQSRKEPRMNTDGHGWKKRKSGSSRAPLTASYFLSRPSMLSRPFHKYTGVVQSHLCSSMCIRGWFFRGITSPLAELLREPLRLLTEAGLSNAEAGNGRTRAVVPGVRKRPIQAAGARLCFPP